MSWSVLEWRMFTSRKCWSSNPAHGACSGVQISSYECFWSSYDHTSSYGSSPGITISMVRFQLRSARLRATARSVRAAVSIGIHDQRNSCWYTPLDRLRAGRLVTVPRKATTRWQCCSSSMPQSRERLRIVPLLESSRCRECCDGRTVHTHHRHSLEMFLFHEK